MFQYSANHREGSTPKHSKQTTGHLLKLDANTKMEKCPLLESHLDYKSRVEIYLKHYNK